MKLDQGRPFQDLEISYRPLELRSAIERAYQTQSLVLLSQIAWQRQDAAMQYFDVQIVPLEAASGETLGVSITFVDMTRSQDLQTELQRTNQQLATANATLQANNEKLETTNEELQSTNEELETTNEELQSTNEELQTINAELQSTNQELQSINAELHQCSRNLHQASTLLHSLLTHLRAGVTVIDA